MKKIILILTIFLISCGRDYMDNQNTIIITDIESTKDCCLYYGKGRYGSNSNWALLKFCFIDSCGKYTIGDTIKIIKK